MSNATDETTMYVTLERRSQYHEGGMLRVVQTTANRPTRRPRGTIVVAIKVRVPRAAFVERQITATVDVPLEKLLDVETDAEVEVVV